MFKDLNDIKEFIKWCKSNKIKSFSIKDVAIEISDIAFIEELNDDKTEVSSILLEQAQEIAEDSKFEKEQQTKEDDELLFWSAD